MGNKIKISMIFFIGIVMFNAPIWACDAAGPDKHVGQITAVDKEAGTFTILDAQTRSSITFMASAELMAAAEQVQGQVMVDYIEDETGLIAEAIN